MSKNIIDLLRGDGSVVVNKSLIFAIGIKEAMVFSELASRYIYFYTRNKLTEDGLFFNTIDDLQLGTGLSGKQQKTAIKNLEKLGLVKQENREDNKRYFKIETSDEILGKYLKIGMEKTREITMKQEKRKKYLLEKKQQYKNKKQLLQNGVTEEKQGVQVLEENRLLQNGVIGYSKMELLVTPKGSNNNTNLNNTNLNNTNHSFIQEKKGKKNDGLNEEIKINIIDGLEEGAKEIAISIDVVEEKNILGQFKDDMQKLNENKKDQSDKKIDIKSLIEEYEEDIVNEAIRRSENSKSPIVDFYKYIKVTCENIVEIMKIRNNVPKSPAGGSNQSTNKFNNFQQRGTKYSNEELEKMIRWKR